MNPPVLIVRPEPSRGLGAFYRNLGLSMLAAHARTHGLDPRLVDLTFDDPSSLDAVGRAKVALFSLYIDDFSQGMEVAARLKRDHGVTTVVGGPHASLLGANVHRVTDAFDLVGVGDCLPQAMPIIAAAARGEALPADRVVTSPGPRARMDPVPPDYRIWRAGRYFPVFPTEFSRGCRQRCPFCTDPVLRRGLAVDPVERTMTTIRGLVADHGPVSVRFVDSSMSSLGADLDRLLDALITAALPVRWSAYAYPHDITARLAQRMATAGCRALFLGVESLAAGVRVGKHHTKRPEEVAAAVDSLRTVGIFSHGNFIIGLPGETPDTLAQTLRALRGIPFDSVGGGPFYLTPGSTFHRRPDKFGITILHPDWTLRQHLSFHDSGHTYFRTATLSQPHMWDLAAEFRRQVQIDGVSCWNLSDYAALCWLSVGGDLAALTTLWRRPDERLTAEQRLVIGVLKEKNGVSAGDRAAGFVELTRRVAAGVNTPVRTR